MGGARVGQGLASGLRVIVCRQRRDGVSRETSTTDTLTRGVRRPSWTSGKPLSVRQGRDGALRPLPRASALESSPFTGGARHTAGNSGAPFRGVFAGSAFGTDWGESCGCWVWRWVSRSCSCSRPRRFVRAADRVATGEVGVLEVCGKGGRGLGGVHQRAPRAVFARRNGGGAGGSDYGEGRSPTTRDLGPPRVVPLRTRARPDLGRPRGASASAISAPSRACAGCRLEAQTAVDVRTVGV